MDWSSVLVSSGVTLLIVGGLLAQLKTFLQAVLSWVLRQFFIQVQFTQGEDTYRWVMQWVRALVTLPMWEKT